MIGGLLRLFWDSGQTAVPPPQEELQASGGGMGRRDHDDDDQLTAEYYEQANEAALGIIMQMVMIGVIE